MDPTATEHGGSGLTHLADGGVSVWLDGMSRGALRAGRLASLVGEGVVGVATSPESFAAALLDRGPYAADLDTLARTGSERAESALTLIAVDVRETCDALREVFEATGGREGWVSAPIDPRLARDTDATLIAVRAMHSLVDRPNVLISVPATKQGLFAILAAVAEGLSVTATSVFSLDRFRAVQSAYVEGLERARSAGHDLAGIASFAALPLAPVDTAIDAVLDEVGTEPAAEIRGRLAIANAVLAYEAFEARLLLPRWRDLAAAGARPQRPMWTSTTVQDPAYRHTRYVDELVAPGAAAAMDEETLADVARDAEIGADTIHAVYAAAQDALDDAERLGVPLSKVKASLEEESLARSAQAWNELLALLPEPR